MKISTFLNRYIIAPILFLLIFNQSYAQRNYATTQARGTSGVCLGCGVTDAANAADGNLQSFSVLNVTVGLLGGQAYQELIFPAAGGVPANTPVTVKLGTGNNLIDAALLGGIKLQAFNGAATAGPSISGTSLLSVLSSNDQQEVSITPTQKYDRIRITLDGGLLAAASSIYIYDAFYNSTGPAPCNSAIDELHGVSSALLGLGLNVGGVQNPQNAIDGNLNTASTLNAGVGALGAYAEQTIIFQNPSVQGDSVRVTLSLPPSFLLSATILDNINITTFNGNVSNNDTQNFNSSLLHLSLLGLDGASQKATITYAPAAVFDRVQIRLGGVASVLSTMNLYEAQRVIPRPVIKFNNVVTNNPQICAGSTATLTANPVANTVFNWYTQATGGAAIASATGTFTTPALTTTTTYYVEAVRTGCTDASERTPVVVTVNAIPAAPVVTNNNISVCSGSAATFVAQNVPGVTVNWYDAASGGNLVGTGNTFTSPALTATTNYYAEALSGGTCISPARTQVTATVSPLPTAPGLTSPSVTICDGDMAVLSVASPVAGTTYNWYNAATGGTLLFTGANYTTPALHTNTSYYVEAVNANGCSSSARTQGTVTVQPKPADPTLAAGATTISAGQTATITVTNAQTGITYNWYTSANSTSPVFTGTTYTTPILSANTTYYVGAVNSTGCTSANRTAITINVSLTIAPCAFAGTQTNTVNGVCIGCGVSTPELAIDADTTTSSTINVLAGAVGSYVEQQLVFQHPGLPGDSIKLGLQTPVALLSAGLLSNIQVILFNGATQTASYSLDNSLIKLRLLSGGTRSNVIVPATVPYDRVTVRLTVGALSALSTLQIFYAQQVFPAPVFSPVSPEVCKGSPATINITTPTNGTLTWYTSPTGGTVLTTGNTYTTGPLTANTTYYVEYTRDGCTDGIFHPVNVTVNDVPVKPVAAFNDVTIYSGQTATLTATGANGATVKWYDAATGGNLVATGNTFTTAPLTATTPFYAEASLGSCVSADRTLVNVNVLPVVTPDVAVNPPTQTINAGETASFTASSTTPGAVFRWYTSPAGGTPVFTGPTFTTPPQFSATNTYYAEAYIPVSGAVSATRATATVNVNTGGISAVPCDAAIDQTTDINGLCLFCSVDNANGSVDNDRNTFSQIHVPVGLLGAYAQQTLRFASTGRAGDSVVVELGVPGSLADVSILSGINLATYNGATFNNDRITVDGSLINVSLIGGTSRFRIAFKAGADFDRVEIRLNSGAATLLTALNVYDVAQEVAAPVIAAPNVTVCEGSQATLTATVPSYVTVKWYTTAAGGSPVFTGNVFTTPVLNATTTYYAEASRTGDGCAQAVRTPATVTITPIPAAPVVPTQTVTVCSGQPAVFAATPVAGVTHNWYTAATGGTPVFTGDTFTTDPLTANATFYVDASNGSCANSTRTSVNANVNNVISDPTVAQNPVTTCSGSGAVLTATSTQPGVTFNWYTAATGGSPVFTGAQFTTPALTANTSYYVEASSGTCISANRVKVDVTVNPAPVAPTVTVTPTGGQITSGQTAVLKATSTTPGVTFNWYTAAIGGTPIFTGDTYTTPILTSNTTYYVESALPTGCISATRTAVTITVTPIFSTTCDFASSESHGAVGACVLCSITGESNPVDVDTTNFSRINTALTLLGGSYQQTLIFSTPGALGDTVTVKLHTPDGLLSASVLGSIQIQSYNGAATANADQVALNSSLIKVTVLSGGQTVLVKFAPGATFDRVQITLNGGLAGLLNNLDIYYASKQVEAPQLATNTVNICAGNTATFTVSNARAGVTYTWYDAPVGGNVVGNGATFTSVALSATTTFYVESSRGGACPNPNRVAATANVSPSPLPPTLANDTFNICTGDNVVLSVTNANGATVNWYDAPTGGNLVFTGAQFQVTPIIGISYYAELTNGTCTSPARKKATITVNPRPAKPGVVSASVTVCAGSPAQLQVLNPEANVTYDWYDAAVGGTLKHSGTTYTTVPVTQNTIFYVQATSTVGGCVNNGGRTAVNVNTDGTIANPALSATQTTVCYGGGTSISVVNPVNGIQYKWYDAAAAGNLIFTGTTFTINNLTSNVSYYVEASNASGCISNSRTKTSITVLPIPTAPTVQADANGLNVCMGSATTLNIVNPQVDQVYRWYDAQTNGTLLFAGTQFKTPALVANTTYYVEASTAGNCNPSNRTPVTVTVNALPTDPAVVSANVQVCAGSPATFNISSPQVGVKYQWYDSPALTNKLSEGNSFTTSPITVNKMFYVLAVNVSGCTSTNVTSVQATILPPPPAPIVANGAVVQDCSGSQVTLTIANPQNGYTYNWYDAATGGNLVSPGASFTTTALTGNVTYYAEAVNNIGCTSLSRTRVDINVNPLPVAPVVTAQGGSSTPTVCAGNSVVLNATSTTPGVVFNWYSQAAGGTMLATGATYTAGPLNTTTTYYVEAVATTGCVSATRTAISITVVTPPATPVPVAAIVTVCAGSPASLAVATPLQNITYNWYDSATKTTLLHTGPTYTTGPVNANTTYYVEASNGSCNSSSLASVQVNINALPSAPQVLNSNVAGCANSQVILSVVNPQAGFTYNWYTSATNGAALTGGVNFTTPQITANATYYVEAVNTTGCASATRTAVNVTLSPAPQAPQAGTQGTDICAGNTATINATSNDPGVTISWYAVATGGTALGSGNSFTTPVLNDNATYYAEAVYTAGGCPSLTRTPVSITVRQPLSKPVVRVASTTISSVTFQWDAVAGAVGYEVSLDNGLTFTTPSTGATGLSHTVDGLIVNQSVTIIVRALGGSACQLGTLSDAVTGKSSNPLGNEIFVPNAFTPNGDGNNDIVYVYGTNIKSLTFTIYNQYGEMIFRSLSQSSGWDGTYKGTRQPVGVYVYILEATMNDGQPVKMKGSITLLR